MLSNEVSTTLLCWPNSQQHPFFQSRQMASFYASHCMFMAFNSKLKKMCSLDAIISLMHPKDLFVIYLLSKISEILYCKPFCPIIKMWYLEYKPAFYQSGQSKKLWWRSDIYVCVRSLLKWQLKITMTIFM